MYEIAKKARESLKSKAKRIAAGEPGAKVDSSSYEPPKDALNADVKTGLRPVSRRAFKSGGKVQGAKPKANLGVTPRSYANAKINRNVKDANEDREGIKHVGGMKKGGRACYDDGGPAPRSAWERIKNKLGIAQKSTHSGDSNQPPIPEADREAMKKKTEEASKMKKGGRAKKTNGGYLNSLHPRGGNEGRYMVPSDAANAKMSEAARAAMYNRQKTDYESAESQTEFDKKSARGSDFSRAQDRADVAKKQADYAREENKPYENYFGMKKGGRTKKAIGGALGQYLSPVLMLANAARGDRDDKKKGGRAKKNMGGPMMGDPRMSMVKDKAMEFAGNPVTPGLKNGGKAKHPDEAMDKALIKKMVKPEARTGKAHGGMKRMNRKSGGQVFSGAGYPEKIPGVVPGGRTARKDGGRAKGKTDINIIISTGKKPDDQMMAPPPGAPPPGLPVPVPGGPQGGPPPMPMAAPPAPPPQMPPQMPPMARKRGGRASYKDMTAGAGSGEGRLQKTEIQANKRPERKAGGKVYRSYKDMDAGAGSGLGRLEKTEIQSRKH